MERDGNNNGGNVIKLIFTRSNARFLASLVCVSLFTVALVELWPLEVREESLVEAKPIDARSLLSAHGASLESEETHLTNAATTPRLLGTKNTASLRALEKEKSRIVKEQRELVAQQQEIEETLKEMDASQLLTSQTTSLASQTATVLLKSETSTAVTKKTPTGKNKKLSALLAQVHSADRAAALAGKLYQQNEALGQQLAVQAQAKQARAEVLKLQAAQLAASIAVKEEIGIANTLEAEVVQYATVQTEKKRVAAELRIMASENKDKLNKAIEEAAAGVEEAEAMSAKVQVDRLLADVQSHLQKASHVHQEGEMGVIVTP